MNLNFSRFRGRIDPDLLTGPFILLENPEALFAFIIVTCVSQF